MKLQVRRKKEIIKMRAEINKTESLKNTKDRERGGRVNPPHIQLSPGPLPGLYCEWGDMEKKYKVQ